MERRRFLPLALVLTIYLSVFSFTKPIYASTGTGVLLGTGNVNLASGVIDYDIIGYVYYASNTSTSITVNSLVQYIHNYGSLDVDTVRFVVFDDQYVKYHAREYGVTVLQGENKRVEADWTIFYSGNNTYTKTGTNHFVRTDIFAGGSWGSFGGWNCFWFPTYRSANFYY